MMPNDLYEELLGENMRLKNKRTGDVWEFDGISMAISDSTKEKLGARGCSGSCYARSLSELNEEWEDYKPAEPIIKDEKIRKAVRAWSEICSLYSQPVAVAVRNKYLKIFASGECSFGCPICSPAEKKNLLKNIKKYKRYTIAELCGEAR